jgi:signal transduction histidine kinase
MDYKKPLNGIIFLILFVSGASALWSQNWSNLFVIALTIALSALPVYLHRQFQIRISSKLRFGMVVFLFSTLFLGEVNHFYDTYQWWDAALHFTAGLGLTIFGFVLLKEIYNHSELRSTPAMTSFFAFCFTGMAAAVWEIYEFLIDMTDLAEGAMQPSNADTMYDLIVALIAAGIVCVFGYRFLRYNEKNLAAEMINGTRQESGRKPG